MAVILFFSASDKLSMPDTLGHSVGSERFELLARAAGNEVGRCVPELSLASGATQNWNTY